MRGWSVLTSRIFNRGKERGLSAVEELRGSDWEGNEEYQYTEWESSDKNRKFVMLVYGGEGYGFKYFKEIRMLAKNNGGFAEIIRAQAITAPDNLDVKYNLYLDAVSQDNDASWLVGLFFSGSDSRGTYTPYCWSNPMISDRSFGVESEELSRLWVRGWLDAGLFHIDDVPFEVDINQTVVRFISQIQQGDFSRPELVHLKNQLAGPFKLP